MNNQITDQAEEASLNHYANEFSDDDMEAAADPEACRWVSTETAYLYYCSC